MKPAGDAAAADLERRLGHEFSRPDLLLTALTHGSAGAQETYQRLEFLGDRVLGLIVTEMLIDAFPKAPEGELSRRLAELVRKEKGDKGGEGSFGPLLVPGRPLTGVGG